MDIGKAFTFVTDEEGWIGKLAIGGVISFFSWLILPLFFLIGYQVAVIRNVMNREEHPLPQWTDWGKLFVDGGILGVTIFVYALPLVLSFLCYWIIFLLPVLGAGNDDVAAALGGVGILVSILLSCVLLIYGIALAFIVPSLYIQYARTGEFGTLFRFGEIIAFTRENLVDILLTLLATWAASFVLQLVSAILWITICGGIIATFVGSVWIMVAGAHLYGQIAAKAQEKSVGTAFA